MGVEMVFMPFMRQAEIYGRGWFVRRPVTAAGRPTTRNPRLITARRAACADIGSKPIMMLTVQIQPFWLPPW